MLNMIRFSTRDVIISYTCVQQRRIQQAAADEAELIFIFY